MKKVIKTPYHPRQRYPTRDSTPARNNHEIITENIIPTSSSSSANNDILEPELTEKEKEDILKYVETEATEVEPLDDTTLKRMILLFEKRALRNQEMRVKFPDQPEK